MADIYLRSTDGLDADSGATWALAKALLTAALTAAGAGGRVFVSDNHAETQAAALTVTSPGTSASITAVICVDDTGNPEPPTALSTTGSVSNTGAFNMTFSGFAACYGLTWNVGNSTNNGTFNYTNTTSWHWIHRSSVKVVRGTAAAARFVVMGAGSGNESLLELLATDVQFNNAAHAFNSGGMLRWYGGSLTLGTAPTGGLVKPLAGASTLVEIRGVDLNNLGTNPLMEVGQGAPGGYFDVIHCKLSSSHTVSTITTGTYDGLGHARLRVHRCVATDTGRSWDLMEIDYCGSVTATNARVRTGGADDNSPAPYCHRMISSAGASFYAPLYSPRYAIPIFAVGSSLTLTVQIFIDQAAALTDADVFAELEYEGTSGNSLGVITNTRRGILSSSTNLTSSSASWSGSATNPQARQIAITFTPQEVGVAFVRIGLMAASKTLDVDPPQRAQVA